MEPNTENVELSDEKFHQETMLTEPHQKDTVQVIVPAREGSKYSYGDVLETIGCGKAQVLLLFILGMIPFCMGTMIICYMMLHHLLTCKWELTKQQSLGYFIMIVMVLILGNIIFGFVSDKWSRKKSFIISLAINAVFHVASCASISKEVMIPLQFIALIGIGGSFQYVVYAFEMFPKLFRLKGLVYLSCIGGLGYFVSFAIGVSTADTDIRITIGAHSIIPFITFFMSFLLPESPVSSFLSKGNEKDAQHVITVAAVMNKKTLKSGMINVGKDFRQPFCKVLGNSSYLKHAALFFVLAFLLGIYMVGVGVIIGRISKSFMDEYKECPLDMTLTVHEDRCKDEKKAIWAFVGYGFIKIIGALLALLLGTFLQFRWCLVVINFVSGIIVFLFFVCVNKYIFWVFSGTACVLIETIFTLLSIIFLSSFPSRIRGTMWGFGVFVCSLGEILICLCYFIQVSLIIPIAIVGSVQIIASLISLLLPTEGEKRPIF